MMAGGMREDPGAMNDCAALGILGPEPERLEPRNGNRGSAHGAGLERDPQGAVIEPRAFRARFLLRGSPPSRHER